MAAFENLPNFRQAGGVGLTNRHGQRVKDGLLYRSSRTDFITSKDKTLFLQLGIKSIIDTRGRKPFSESNSKPLQDLYTACKVRDGRVFDIESPSETSVGRLYYVNFYTEKLKWHIFKQAHILIRLLCAFILHPIDKLFGTKLVIKLYGRLVLRHQSLVTQYLDYLEYSKHVVASTLRLLLNIELPVLIHCAFGKDRTGVLVALILNCLEVEDKIIIEDYAKSEEELVVMKDQLYQELIIEWGVAQHNCHALPETMEGMLAELRKRYGSVSDYLTSAGFTVEEQTKLKSIFLEGH